MNELIFGFICFIDEKERSDRVNNLIEPYFHPKVPGKIFEQMDYSIDTRS